jgi:hypothetical protein
MNIKEIFMIVKFFSRGSGGGDGPTDYLLGDERDRVGASTLRGNAEITKELINSTDYARRYTSGCLSFEENHKDITDEVKSKIMDNFEKVLFAGLFPDNYNILWVQHTDKNDRLELNFLIPNQELRSGKRLQPFYHAADMKRVDAFQTVMNLNFKLSDPNDPKKRRIDNPHFSREANLKDVSEKEKTSEHTELERHQETKNALTKYFHGLAERGALPSRRAIQDTLISKGYEVTRVTNKAISIKSPKFNKNIRLDDPIFSKNFRQYNYIPVGVAKKEREYEEQKHITLKEALEVLNEGLKIKRAYHAERFKDAPLPEPMDLDLGASEATQAHIGEPAKPSPRSNDISSPSTNY